MKPGYPDRMLLHNHRIRMEQPRASPVHALAGEARDFAQRDRQATAPANATRTAPGRRGFRASPDRPLDMLRRCPAYAPTPLRALPGLAATLGLGALHAKDETGRMGLGSFKALGGVFAVAQTIAEAAGTSDPASDEAARIAKGMTFITASAGNHGLSLAAGARVFGARAVIVLPSLAPEGFAGRIRSTGAEVVRIAGSYDDAVACALDMARSRGWLLLADGSWDGYVERPALVMEGYTVLAEECRATFEASGEWPSHVLLQAGVGGLAAAVAGHVREHWARQPVIIVVEPEAAPGLMRSVEAGRLVRAEGPVSNMGRLDCKVASLLGFETLRCEADVFATVSDDGAATAAETLARHGMATTPSGAAALAALGELAPGPASRCLIVVSEGPVGG